MALSYGNICKRFSRNCMECPNASIIHPDVDEERNVRSGVYCNIYNTDIAFDGDGDVVSYYESEADDSIDVIIITPGQEPVAKKIANNLDAIQYIIGGYAEILPINDYDHVAIICENAKALGYPSNNVLDQYGGVHGTIIFVNDHDGMFASLTKEQQNAILQRYSNNDSVEECCGSKCFQCQDGRITDFASAQGGFRIYKRIVSCNRFNIKIEFDEQDIEMLEDKIIHN